MGIFENMQANAQSIVTSAPRRTSKHGKSALMVARSNVATLVQSETKNNFKDIVKELINLKNSNALDDDVFAEVLEAVLASYVELEVNAKIDNILTSQLSTIRFVK